MAIVAGALMALSPLPLAAQEHGHDHQHDHGHHHDHDQKHDHNHAHDHSHADDRAAAIGKGYFADSDIHPRALSDWAGEWQSVYPYLMDGTLDPVMARKAEQSGKDGEAKTAADYRAYYEKGYRTTTDHIVIAGEDVRFDAGGKQVAARYRSDGFESLTYAKGNRGVRFVFAKVSGDAAAPAFIQFSDHLVAPQKAGHFHLYWGDDRAALLAELEHWPTYYPAALDGAGIREEMLAH